MMDDFAKAVTKIIQEQELIIGPVALEQAKKVTGLKLDWDNRKVEFEGDRTKIVDNLVKQYQSLFGQTSVEVCKEAAHGLFASLSKDQIPFSLR